MTSAPGGAAARKLTREAQDALDAVASGRQLSPGLRTEIRAAHKLEPWFNFFSFVAMLFGMAVFQIEVGLVKEVGLFGRLTVLPSRVSALLMALVLYGMLFVAVWATKWTANKIVSTLDEKWQSHRTLEPVLRALAACALAERVDDLPRLLRACERAVRQARNRRGTVPRFSHRQRALKDHAGRVVAALRVAESGLDTYPELARCDLAAKLHSIAEAYVEGRLGALLPESDLKDVQPLRGFETTRLIALAAAYPVLTWTAGTVGLAGEVQAQTAMVGMLIAAAGLFGRRALSTLQKLWALFGR
ncbi:MULTISPECIES: hypothetical protein [Kitasatospora]|uniref:Uncharacterized protein n=1 Tax=Kitasatospora setae (strain ATCC 33774 / DSM 43861 / JCM 3304 / KCC A-0304 / NBRC 14216 / KM-6054) TaxID=452652 RepID=E4NCY3_KITSK|nr:MULTISPECIES: hypothetical protein [Kitasatospora]BAJ29064.1 hypothetical protein KSE_32550 [Kitasatospora setae KM-6054]